MAFKRSVLVLMLVTVASFAPVLTADFVNWDDDSHVLQNKLVLNFTPANIPQIFLQPDSANRTYQPLTTLTWAIEYALFGKNPLVFHLTNLLLHLGVVVLVFLLAGRFGLGPWGAFAAALVFAIHPSRVENVAWVTARKDLLYGFFYLLSILAYLNYLDRLPDKRPDGKGAARRAAWVGPYLWALFWGLLSILSKAMALSLPWVLWLVDWMKKRPFSRTMLLDKAPFFLIIEPLAWVTYAQNTREIVLNFPDGFLVWFWSAAFYVQKFLWPGTLSPVYAMPEPVRLTNLAYWGSFMVLVAVGVALWRWAQNRWLVFAFSFYFLCMFFLWRFDWRDISVVADRFLYIPSFAACLALGYFVEWYLKKKDPLRRSSVAAFVLVALAYAVNTFVYSFSWRTGFDLWSSVAENSPAIAFAYNNRGAFHVKEGRFDLARRDFETAIKVASRHRVYKDGKALLPVKDAAQYAKAYYNMGLLAAKEKDHKAALNYFNLAIYYDLEKPEYFVNRGVTYSKLGDKDKALLDYNTALALDQDLYEARINRGLILYKRGHRQEALEDFLKAAESAPAFAEGYLQAGRIYFEDRDLVNAKRMFEAAAKAEPENAQALFNLGSVYANMGDAKKAQMYFSQAHIKWLKDPEKYPLPGLDPKDAKFWAERLGK